MATGIMRAMLGVRPKCEHSLLTMPFTPFHFGPGAAIKAVAPRHFSFTVFCFAQVVTDFEPAYYMVQGAYPLASLLSYLRRCNVRRRLQHFRRSPHLSVRSTDLVSIAKYALQGIFSNSTVIPWGSAAAGAFIGTYSHVFLDIMHRDTMPLMPFSAANPLYLLIGPGALHLVCLMLGVFGAFYFASRNRNA